MAIPVPKQVGGIASNAFPWRNDTSSPWTVGNFECCNSELGGGLCAALQCFLFPCCHNASTVTELVSTNWLFACLCYPAWLTRNQIRNRFNINEEEGPCTDLLCSCCPIVNHITLGKNRAEIYNRKNTMHFTTESGEAWFKQKILERSGGKMAQSEKDKATWAMGLCECPLEADCCITFLCPTFAAAKVKQSFDGKSELTGTLINCCCLPPAVTYNLVRESLGKEGDFVTDIIFNCCFVPCAVNRMRMEVDRITDPVGFEQRYGKK